MRQAAFEIMSCCPYILKS